MPKRPVCNKCEARPRLQRFTVTCDRGFTHPRFRCTACGREWDEQDVERDSVTLPATLADEFEQRGFATVPEWDRFAKGQKARRT